MVFKYLIEKEFKQIFRNKFLPKLFVMMPTVMLLVMPWAANQEVKNLKLSVVDNDHSPYSQRLIQKVDASRYFSLSTVSQSYGEAFDNIESGDADMILEVEPDFEKNIVSTGEGRVLISANAVNGTKSGLGSAYLSNIVSDYTSDLMDDAGVQPATKGFSIAPYYEFNPHLDYKVFMVPALMVMILTLFAGFLPALNIVGEKEKGTMEQINVTPVGKFQFILSKLVPYWVVGFFVLSYFMLLAWLIYGLAPAGNLLTIYLFATIYVLLLSGLGLVVSNYSSTMQQAVFVMYFFMIIFILMSGLFTPINSMPQWAQCITYVNPLRYFIDVMRMVYLKGSAFSELASRFWSLCGFAVVLIVWAVASYKKSC